MNETFLNGYLRDLGKSYDNEYVPTQIVDSKKGEGSINVLRKDWLIWLKQNWDFRFTSPVTVQISPERSGRVTKQRTVSEKYLLKNIHFAPGRTSLQDSILHIDLIRLKHIKQFGCLKVNVPIRYLNAQKLKFGFLVILKRKLKFKIKKASFDKFIEVDLFKSLSVKKRILRVSDLKIPAGMILDEEVSTILCKSLKSSQERKAIHEKWIEAKTED